MQFTNKVFTISYHKFYKREFWESLMEHSSFDKALPFWNICEEFVSIFHSMMAERNLQMDDFQLSFSFSEDGQLDIIHIYCFLEEEDVEIKSVMIKNNKNGLNEVGIFLDHLVAPYVQKETCERNNYRYLLIEQKELIILLNLLYQYISDTKINITRQNRHDTIEFFVYDPMTDTEKKEELFSLQPSEEHHLMRTVTKIEKVATNRTIRNEDYDKILVMKDIVNYSTILNFNTGSLNLVGKTVPYEDGNRMIKSLFSFQFNDLINNYKILDGHQGLLLEL